MPFIRGLWSEPQKEIIDSIDISSSSVNLTHISSRESSGEYLATFGVVVFSHKFDFQDPSILRKVNKASLKKAIFNSLKAEDRKYFEIQRFGMKTVTFKFLWRKWFQDSTKGIRPQKHLSKFEKAFSFNKQLPGMIRYNFSAYTDKFVIRKFRNYASERKMNNWFQGFLPREYDRKIRAKTSDMFEYSYDVQFNKIIMRLKNVYILGILFAVGQKVDLRNRQPYVKINFNQKVKGRANKFNRMKWETFIKRKFI